MLAREYAMGIILRHHLKRVTVVMPPELHRKLKFIGINDDTTMNALILDAVQQYLSEYGSKSSIQDDD